VFAQCGLFYFHYKAPLTCPRLDLTDPSVGTNNSEQDI